MGKTTLLLAAVAVCLKLSAGLNEFHSDLSHAQNDINYHGTTFARDQNFGRNVLRFNGNSYAEIPAVHIQQSDFAIEMWFKSTANGKRQVLLADWSKPWQFMIEIQSNGKIQVTLRRNINSAGSDPKQNLIVATGGSVKRGVWQHLVVKYRNKVGTCVVYLNGPKVADVTTTWGDHNLQVNSHATFEVGYKKDSRNEFFLGDIGFLSINGKTQKVGQTGGYANNALSGPLDNVKLSEEGAAFVYDDEFERMVLEFDGISGYASYPAVKFQKTDFAIELWFQSFANNKRQVIFADWSKPWQFMIEIQSNGQIQVSLRRNINSAGSDPNQNLIVATGGSVKRGVWQHLVIKYRNSLGNCAIYLDDDNVADFTTKWPNHDLQENNHSTYEIAYKKDSRSEFFKGRIGYLSIHGASYSSGYHGCPT